MKDKSIINSQTLSDDKIIKSIGEFVRHHRLAQNISQKDLSIKAGINRTTLSDLELGRRCQLLTLIQVLRTLNQLHVFESFKIEEQISPLALAELEMKKRQKAKSKKETNETRKADW